MFQFFRRIRRSIIKSGNARKYIIAPSGDNHSEHLLERTNENQKAFIKGVGLIILSLLLMQCDVKKNKVGEGTLNGGTKVELYDNGTWQVKTQVISPAPLRPETKIISSYNIGDILPDGSMIFHIDSNGQNGLTTQTEDLGWLKWDEAVIACKKNGDEWRLPTKDELNMIYNNLHIKGLGNLEDGSYWSSTEGGDFDTAWDQYFEGGFQSELEKDYIRLARAVREF
ncbi:MAG: hypothetical protein AAF502_20340 [Bacteroidota bacterium]